MTALLNKTVTRMINTFGDFRIDHRGLERDYQLLFEAYLELREELDRIVGRATSGATD